MAKKILGMVREAGKGDDRRTKNAALTTHTLRTIENRKQDAAKATRMITTRDSARTK